LPAITAGLVEMTMPDSRKAKGLTGSLKTAQIISDSFYPFIITVSGKTEEKTRPDKQSRN